MSAGKLDITIEQGATFTRKLTLKDSEGVVIDLTDYVVRSQIRRDPRSTDIIKEFDFVIDAPATGVIDWEMSAEDSDSISVSSGQGFSPAFYYYDVEIEAPSGEVTRVLQGTVKVIPNVTRET